MKVNIQKIAAKLKMLAFKAFPVIAVFTVLLSSVIPVHAETINGLKVLDYNDYIVRVSVDGENDLCVVQFPTSMWSLGFIHDGTSEPIVMRNDYIRWRYGSSTGVDIQFAISMGAVLGLSNVPTGSVLEFRMTTTLYDEETPEIEGNFSMSSIIAQLQYRDSNLNPIANAEQRYTKNLDIQGYHSYRIKISKPQNAYACVPVIKWNDLYAPNTGLYEFSIDQCQMVFTISSFYREGIHLEDNNDLLVIITGQLANNFQKQEEFYEYMEEEMGVTNDKVDELLDDYAVIDKKLNNIEVQNATIIQQNMDALENDQIMIDQNETMIEGSEAAQETVSWLDEYVAGVKDMMDDMANDMEVDKPSVNAGDFRPNQFVDQVVFSNYTNVLSTTWRNPNIETMVLVVSALVLVSFIFFGKKK